MKISFDLDDLLIPGTKGFPTEPPTVLAKILQTEPLRLGAPSLLKELRAQGYTVCIYTTSLRSPWRIRLTFAAHGVCLSDVINQGRHENEIQARGISCSKYPPMFGIDIHVDDSEGVGLEARQHGFGAIIISEHDEDWMETVVHAIQARR